MTESFALDRPLYFNHIPKTAGTTLTYLIDRFFPEQQIFPGQVWDDLKGHPIDYARGFSLYRGHFGGNGLVPFVKEPLNRITMLRHPFARALSCFEFARRTPNHPKHPILMADNFTFEQFLSDRRTRGNAKNNQVTNLLFAFADDAPFHELECLGDEQPTRQWVTTYRKATRGTGKLKRAMDALIGYRFFGLVEDFPASLALLCFTFAWPPIKAVETLNHGGTATQSKTLPDSTLRKLTQMNRLDLQLYQFAQRLFRQRFREMLLFLKQRYDHQHTIGSDLSYSDINVIYDLLDQHYLAIRWDNDCRATHGIHYDFRDTLWGDGWHRREFAHANGSSFRWTGPDNLSTIDFQVPNKTDLQFTMQIINAIGSDVIGNLGIRANGNTLPTKVTAGARYVRTLAGVIPAGTVRQNGFLRLEIETPRVATANRRLGDTRRIGIAVNRIRFQPAGHNRRDMSDIRWPKLLQRFKRSLESVNASR